MSTDETADLFVTVKHVSRTIERLYEATSLNVAVQDGADAGQSVPHVHVHIIPRKSHDMDAQGGSDSIYGMMDGEPGNIGKAFLALQKYKEARKGDRDFAAGPDSERRPRTAEEMQDEADWLRQEIQKDQNA